MMSCFLSSAYASQNHDVVFWMGDLNYRIDMSVAAPEVLKHALARRLGLLKEKDQLNCAREAGDAFQGFQEGEPTSMVVTVVPVERENASCIFVSLRPRPRDPSTSILLCACRPQSLSGESFTCPELLPLMLSRILTIRALI